MSPGISSPLCRAFFFKKKNSSPPSLSLFLSSIYFFFIIFKKKNSRSQKILKSVCVCVYAFIQGKGGRVATDEPKKKKHFRIPFFFWRFSIPLPSRTHTHILSRPITKLPNKKKKRERKKKLFSPWVLSTFVVTWILRMRNLLPVFFFLFYIVFFFCAVAFLVFLFYFYFC